MGLNLEILPRNHPQNLGPIMCDLTQNYWAYFQTTNPTNQPTAASGTPAEGCTSKTREIYAWKTQGIREVSSATTWRRSQFEVLNISWRIVQRWFPFVFVFRGFSTALGVLYCFHLSPGVCKRNKNLCGWKWCNDGGSTTQPVLRSERRNISRKGKLLCRSCGNCSRRHCRRKSLLQMCPPVSDPQGWTVFQTCHMSCHRFMGVNFML